MAVLLTAMLTGCSRLYCHSRLLLPETKQKKVTIRPASMYPSPASNSRLPEASCSRMKASGKTASNCSASMRGQFVGIGKVGEFGEIKGFRRDETATSYKMATRYISIMEEQPLEISLQPDSQTRRLASIWWPIQKASTKTIDWDNQAKWVGMHENILMTTFETDMVRTRLPIPATGATSRKTLPKAQGVSEARIPKRRISIIHLPSETEPRFLLDLEQCE